MKKIIAILILTASAISCGKKIENPKELPYKWVCVFMFHPTNGQRVYLGAEPNGPFHSAKISELIKKYPGWGQETQAIQDSANCSGLPRLTRP